MPLFSWLLYKNLSYVSSENCSSDFDIWIMEFYEFGEFIYRRSGSRDVVHNQDGFVAG